MLDKPITVADYVIWKLSEVGIGHIFILPGGGCMYLVDALARQTHIEAIPLLHEQSVGIAAEAYSQYSGNLGAALVTTGPGGTNAITACAAAWTDSTPVLFISGQVKTSDLSSSSGMRQFGFQEIPITDVVRPISKRAVLLTRSEDIVNVLDDLIVLARSGRPGPVWLDIPLDLQSQKIDKSKPLLVQSTSLFRDDLEANISNLIMALEKAQRPLFLVGNGVRLSGKLDLMEKVIRLSKIPTLLTWKMIDFLDEEDVLNAGRPGAIAQPWSNLLQEEADLLISLGARVDMGQSAYNLQSFAKNADKYIVDIDSFELTKFPHDYQYFLLNYDLQIFLPEFFRQFETSGLKSKVQSWSKWRTRMQRLKSEYRHHIVEKSSNGKQVNLYKFVLELSRVLTPNAIVVPGSSGACSEIVMQAFQIKRGQRVFNSEGLGPMGFGIPAALGACVASGRKQIICIDGDGGFLMNLQELASIKLHADNVIFFVLNNNGYGSIKLTQDKLFAGRRLGTDPSTGLALADLKAIASAFGLKYKELNTEKNLANELKKILKYSSTVIVEVFVDPAQITLPRVKNIRDKDGVPQPANMAEMDY